MSNVEKLLDGKGTEIWQVSPDDTVIEAIRLMEDKSIGALAVLLNEELVGIVSERDYARKVVLKGRSSSDTKVKDIMSRQVFYVTQENTVDHCMVLMTEKRIRHLPVMKNDKMIGMISLGDVVKSIINDQEYKIKQLENYISWEESY